MNRSKIVSRAVVVALGVVGVTGSALAGSVGYGSYGKGPDRDYARNSRDLRDTQFAKVIDVDPIVRRVRVTQPEPSCWVEEQAVQSGPARSEIRGTLIGGLIGAAVGHQLGRHTDAGPVAIIGGSMIGAAIGNGVGASKAQRNGEYVPIRYRDVERCDVSYRDTWEERVEGYEVTYVYNGRKYTTTMPYDPGKRVRVDVNVRPVY